mgnify:CR=1 FL=1
MAIAITSIMSLVISHADSTGHFAVVNGYESKQSPGLGLSAAVWVERITPIKSSGLANTSIRLELTVRLYSSTVSQPYADIDPNLVTATDDLVTAYIGDFELGGEARHIDIFGAHGAGLVARSGYVNQDGAEYRCFNITLPIIVDDVFAQSP